MKTRHILSVIRTIVVAIFLLTAIFLIMTRDAEAQSSCEMQEQNLKFIRAQLDQQKIIWNNARHDLNYFYNEGRVRPGDYSETAGYDTTSPDYWAARTQFEQIDESFRANIINFNQRVEAYNMLCNQR